MSPVEEAAAAEVQPLSVCRLIGVLSASMLQVPNIFPDCKDKCAFTMDKRANSLAVLSDGKVCKGLDVLLPCQMMRACAQASV